MLGHAHRPRLRGEVGRRLEEASEHSYRIPQQPDQVVGVGGETCTVADSRGLAERNRKKVGPAVGSMQAVRGCCDCFRENSSHDRAAGLVHVSVSQTTVGIELRELKTLPGKDVIESQGPVEVEGAVEGPVEDSVEGTIKSTGADGIEGAGEVEGEGAGAGEIGGEALSKIKVLGEVESVGKVDGSVAVTGKDSRAQHQQRDMSRCRPGEIFGYGCPQRRGIDFADPWHAGRMPECRRLVFR